MRDINQPTFDFAPLSLSHIRVAKLKHQKHHTAGLEYTQQLKANDQRGKVGLLLFDSITTPSLLFIISEKMRLVEAPSL